jgi:hypothetical protein
MARSPRAVAGFPTALWPGLLTRPPAVPPRPRPVQDLVIPRRPSVGQVSRSGDRDTTSGPVSPRVVVWSPDQATCDPSHPGTVAGVILPRASDRHVRSASTVWIGEGLGNTPHGSQGFHDLITAPLVFFGPATAITQREWRRATRP